jgi:hypothetical protein
LIILAVATTPLAGTIVAALVMDDNDVVEVELIAVEPESWLALMLLIPEDEVPP